MSMRTNRASARQGTIVVGVLACLIICTSLASLALTTAMRGRREARLMHQKQQVQLLCEAGIQRAVRRLAADPQYRGELWSVPLGLETYSESQVQIEVTTPEVQPAQLDVRVTAQLNAVTHNFGALQRTYKFQTTSSKSESENTK